MEKRDEPESSARATSPLRAVARGLWKSTAHLVLALGWLALAGFVVLWSLEQSGWLAARIETELLRNLTDLGREISVGGAQWNWSDRELVLRDLALGPDGRDARVSRLAVRMGWEEPRGLIVERAEVAGATVNLSRDLLETLRELADHDEHDLQPFGRLILRAVDVNMETPGGTLALGRIDAFVEPRGSEPSDIRGRLVTAPREQGDDPGELLVVGELSREGDLTLRGTGRALPFDTRFIAAGEDFELLRTLDPRARVDLDASAHYVVGRSLLPRLELRLRTSGASARMPQLPDGSDRLEEISLEVEARFDPPDTSRPSIFERRLWSGRALASARCGTLALRSGLELSRNPADPGSLEAWVDAPRVTLGEETLLLLGQPDFLVHDLFPWLAPAGDAAVHAAVRLAASWRPGMPLAPALHAAVCVFPSGRTSAAYHGPPRGGVAGGEGFPLRLDGLTGAVVFAWSPDRPYPDELGLFELAGDHGSGSATVEGSWFRVPHSMRAPEAVQAGTDFWLRAASDGLRIDERLEQAFAGLHAVVPPAELWELFRPTAGELGFAVELWSNAAAPRLATRVDAELAHTSASFLPFPLPVHDVEGSVAVLVDGRRRPQGGGFSVRLDLSARTAAASDPLVLTGRVERTDPAPESAPIEDLVLEANGVDLAAPDLHDALAANAGELTDLVRRTGLAGRADVRLRRVREHSDRGSVTRLELLPESGVGLELPGLDLRAVDLAGRVLARFEEHPLSEGGGLAASAVSAAPLSGALETGGAPVPITLRADLLPSGALDVDTYVSGVDLGDRELLTRLRETFAVGATGPSVPAELPLSGRIDLHADLARPPTGRIEGDVHLHPRGVAVGAAEAPLLAGLEGELVLSADGLRAGELRAQLAQTPIVLSAVVLAPVEGDFELTARVRARGLPLDHAHLSRFVPSQGLRAWIDDLKWRGTVDVGEAALGVRFGAEGLASVAFRGDLALTDVFVQLGVPLAIRSAAARDVELVYEEGTLRAWGRIEDLYAQMDGRRLDDARMLVTFVQPRLTIESFQGRFEDGELSSLGSRDGAGGGFLALDLVPPYPFGLSIEMSGVDLGGLLRGLFQSDFANRGRLRGTLRINGDTAHLLELRGQGFVELLDSSLWSIPVFQALFSQLGFDSTATFDQMRSSFSIERGAIHMRNMRAESPLLHLVGEGTLGLDGSLSHDLEVRYSLVDRLGPITMLLYKIQRSLVHVKIGGDMERPKVVLKGLLPVFFQSGRDVRQLPVPSFSELPTRF